MLCTFSGRFRAQQQPQPAPRSCARPPRPRFNGPGARPAAAVSSATPGAGGSLRMCQLTALDAPPLFARRCPPALCPPGRAPLQPLSPPAAPAGCSVHRCVRPAALIRGPLLYKKCTPAVAVCCNRCSARWGPEGAGKGSAWEQDPCLILTCGVAQPKGFSQRGGPLWLAAGLGGTWFSVSPTPVGALGLDCAWPRARRSSLLRRTLSGGWRQGLCIPID